VSAPAFVSYVHIDNANDMNGIANLARRLGQELSIQSAEHRRVWIDKGELGWGDDWKEGIDEALLGTMFFVPIVTPLYFKSDSCREELITFANSAKRLGLEELILPIY
jgi:hypothetical protein